MTTYSVNITNNTNNTGNYAIFQKQPQASDVSSIAWRTGGTAAPQQNSWVVDYTDAAFLAKIPRTEPATGGSTASNWSADGFVVYDRTGAGQSLDGGSSTAFYL
ncbi:hypothetical protein GCM10007920_23340 [Ciceribacter naphthalenivorans]|uniref:Uncharacterized protein n=2 Tax=Alphaproteobacteria TaxID=28211 RepID=A0A512HGK4_9HYPH|nr:hypothetical protein RNA01_15160 [Ciceribacter naphthalenivorans]GLR22547.1 hypothetical protein GCM10007920_23340 [Ciceribacter naphthalenivorans]GLT05403.1 hypothetical protein GCM10007926_23340 [Sphingomonas psychrolutea]